MASTIHQLFEEYGSHIKFDKKMLKRLTRYVSSFVNKNEDSINFFGDALIGVYPVKYTKEDKDIWFDEVLDMDELSLKKDLHSLESINTSFVVSSDATNQSFIWVAHKFATSKHLSQKDKDRGAIEAMNMMQYKFITSLMSHNFPYPTDKSVALATYAALSKKFAIKNHGSWAKLVLARSMDILGKDSIWYKTYQRHGSDDDLVKMVNDIQGRIREVIKKMVNVFYTVREADARITATSSTIELDGVNHVADRSSDYIASKRYIHTVVSSKDGLIKDPLVKVIGQAVHTVSEKHLLEALEYVTDNYGARKAEFIAELLDECLVYSLGYLRDNDIQSSDLPLVISKLRSSYMSSRSTDPNLMRLRELADMVVKESVTSKSSSTLASARTALLLYIVLRTLTKSHFS
jgi:hypothetical protein